MKYRCTSCDEVFEVPEGDRARCPKCLRIHDVEPVVSGRSKVRRHQGPIVFFGIIAAGVTAYLLWYFTEGEEEPQEEPVAEVGPLTEQELRAQLVARHLKQSEVVIPFAESDEITAFARKAAHGKAAPGEKAQALLDAVRARITDNHEHYVSISPRRSPPHTPSETLRAIESDDGFEPYPYEVAALMVAACRSIGVPAVMAEVFQYSGTKRPTDASGVNGYFVAALPRGGSYRRPVLYDPASGRFDDSADGEAQVLTDVEAVSAVLTLRALYESAHRGNGPLAERLSSLAVKLRPGSATALAAHGTVRLMAGGGELSARSALEEYEQALRIRPDPQRRVLVARILIALQQVDRAEELVRSALADAPEFAAAHAILGLIHLANERTEEAQADLTTAEQLEPRDPQLALLWVQYHLAQRDIPAALDAARAVVDRVPDDPQPRLMLAQALYQDARYEQAEAQFRELLRRNPDNSQLRDLLREAFEYDPSDSELAGDVGPEEHASADDGEPDAGTESADGGDAGTDFQLQMGRGLGKVRLGGPSGFQLGVQGQ
jgi:hypothetical protein